MVGSPLLELRYGYTLADVDQIAAIAAANNHSMAADFRDLVHAAWSAIVDSLYAAEAPLERHELFAVGKGAIWDLVRDHRNVYGYRNQDWSNGVGSAPRFATYWQQVTTPSHEESMIERIAVQQIYEKLSERDQSVIRAAAIFDGDYAKAAASLGISTSAYGTRLSKARRNAADLWHEMETPFRPHRQLQRRQHYGELKPCGTMAAVLRHRKRREPLCALCQPVNSASERERYERRKKRKDAKS